MVLTNAEKQRRFRTRQKQRRIEEEIRVRQAMCLLENFEKLMQCLSDMRLFSQRAIECMNKVSETPF